MNGVAWIDAVVADLRYAGRNLWQRPGFALAAVVTVALGIGATTAIFSAVHAVLLKPLPFADADRIYSAEIVIPERREQIPSVPASIQTYLVWRTIDSAFSGMSALRSWEINLTGDGEPERLGGARVSANFFSFLGVTIPRGRGFDPEEEQAGSDRVVVISDGLWRRRYGADPALVGRAILINGESHQVVGIAPPSLRVPTGNQLHPLVPFASRIDVWRPIAPTAGELRNESWDHGVLVRLAPGQHLEAGRQQLEASLNALVAAQLPNIKTAPFVQLVPVREIFASRIRARLLMVLGAAMLLLLTACAAIANLLLARVITRAHEFATRLALGASRARLVSLTLSEAAIVTLAGGSIGVAIAAVGARGLAAYGPEDVRVADPGVSIPMLAFAIAASVVTALACGIYPAWRASRSDPAVTLQDAGRTSFGGRRAGRLQRVLVGAEMALATALLVSAGLLLQSFAHLMRADRGYAIDNVITADLSLFGDRYAESAQPDRLLSGPRRSDPRTGRRLRGGDDQRSSGGGVIDRRQPHDSAADRPAVRAGRHGAADSRNPQRHVGILRRKRHRAQGRPVPPRRGSGNGGGHQRIAGASPVARRGAAGGGGSSDPAREHEIAAHHDRRRRAGRAARRPRSGAVADRLPPSHAVGQRSDDPGGTRR